MTGNRLPSENPVQYDGRPDLREHIAEMMFMCRHYAALAQRCSEIGDDTGVAYNLRKLSAYHRAAIGSACDLCAAPKISEASS